jgi:hypothetical protein
MIRDREYLNLGATFIEVMCTHDDCRSPHFGEKIIYQAHNGYGEEAPELSESQLNEAMKIATEHDKKFPNHEIRIVQGR